MVTLQLTREDAAFLYQVLEKAQVAGVPACAAVVRLAAALTAQLQPPPVTEAAQEKPPPG